MSKDFLVVDFEFTQYTKPGGKPRGFFSEIIEIGAVRMDGRSREITGSIQNFVKPRFFPKQAAEAMVFCMITESDMKKAIDFGSMLKKVESLYVPGETFFVAWGDADYHVIKQGCERHELPNPVLFEDYLDLAAAYKLLHGDRQTTGLRKAAEEQGVDAGGLWHTAYDDAVNTSHVLLTMLNGGWTPEQYYDIVNPR